MSVERECGICPKHLPCDSALNVYLQKSEWQIEEVKVILERDSSSVNEKSSCNSQTPLIQVLYNKKCSFEIVKLLLEYGADVHLHAHDFSLGKCLSPLFVALVNSRNEAVIKALLEKGANAKSTDRKYRSSICYALRFRAPSGVIKLLMDAGCSLNGCKYHNSLLLCATHYLWKEERDGVIEQLIKGGLDELRVYGRSAVCFALQAGAGPRTIKLLRKKGALLDHCSYHASVLHCAVVTFDLKEDMLQLLLDEGASMDCMDIVDNIGWSPVQLALKCYRYEVNVIKLLLHLPGEDVYKQDKSNNNLLHLALSNYSGCKLDVLKYLVDQGAKLDEVNDKGNTPLHCAVIYNWQSDIVDFLIQHGAPILDENIFGDTPLTCVLSNDIEANVYQDVLKILLNAGIKQCHLYSALKLTLDLYDRELSQKLEENFKMLLKYYFLENWEFAVDDVLIYGHELFMSLEDFVNECEEEAREMSLKDIGYGCTLQEFVSQSSTQIAGEEKKYNFNQLVEVLSKNSFPLYLDVILSKLGRPSLVAKLLEMRVCTVKNIPSPLAFKRKIFLDYDSLYKIVKFLSPDDILSMILAFHIPDDHADCKYARKDVVGCKRSPEQSSKFNKLLKLYH